MHRDIKPENVMLTDRGVAKVADFGLARQVGSPQMTATGVLVGTASYLPPELVTHSRPDARSDVYSAGVVLFEMLTGKKPHTGENNYQIAYRHVNVDIESPSERLADIGHSSDWDIPDYLDAVVLTATARDPRARFNDGRELLHAIRRARQEYARSAGADKPELAAALSPACPSDETAPIAHRPRPRPTVSPTSPAASPTAEPSPDDWAPAEQDEWSSDWQAVTAPVMPRDSHQTPVSPRSHSSAGVARGPRSQRTPVFPQLHISQDPVHRRRRGIIALVLVLLLTAGAGVGSWWWMSGRFTTVPTTVNLNEARAREVLQANDLEPASTSEYSETVAAGVVIRSSPTTGDRLLRGSAVTLIMSKGPERYPMPAVAGITREQAEQAILNGKMTVGEVTEQWHESAPAGQVLGASQEEGAQLKPKTPINLTVSKGPEPIGIKDYTGTDAKAATAALTEAGFEVDVKEENSASVEAGKIITQTPRDGNGKRGDVITVVRSIGPVMVTIPDVAMKSGEEAQKMLEDLDLKVTVERANQFPIPLNVAAGTNPAAGTEVAVGTTVILFVA